MTLLSDKVLFIDGEAIILDKPAGLPVDAPRDGSISLENYLASLTFGFQRWPLAVHRLDRDTSGCLLLARNPKAHKRFAAAFEAGTVEKRYVAVLEGVPEADEGTIELSLKKVSTPSQGWRMIAAKAGKPAVTHWRKLAVKDGPPPDPRVCSSAPCGTTCPYRVTAGPPCSFTQLATSDYVRHSGGTH